MSKLSQEDKLYIQTHLEEKVKDLAKKYGVTKSLISKARMAAKEGKYIKGDTETEKIVCNLAREGKNYRNIADYLMSEKHLLISCKDIKSILDENREKEQRIFLDENEKDFERFKRRISRYKELAQNGNVEFITRNGKKYKPLNPFRDFVLCIDSKGFKESIQYCDIKEAVIVE